MKQTASNNKFLREMKDKHRHTPVCYAIILRAMNRSGEEAAREKARKADETFARFLAEEQASNGENS